MTSNYGRGVSRISKNKNTASGSVDQVNYARRAWAIGHGVRRKGHPLGHCRGGLVDSANLIVLKLRCRRRASTIMSLIEENRAKLLEIWHGHIGVKR